ncbi:MAG TPA: type IV pilus twitching motility protein PilT [Planctomycetota bacterium]|nr:type IV pilus twitching motility protein PilT [Planctomycetota bacterium]HPY75520.1 type IV pilus twitching motility protein PilT [Planctomycetota bacterium]HQB01133.1 type IV pilus twitching motility protein PilT [Planctomycetota bacterium]HRU52406.1 type IV pilus twitching motility protein PilT [Planctomycetota bacterium]
MANENLTIEELVYRLVQEGASDLHITAGSRPKLRIHGVLDDIPEYDILTPEMTQRLLYSILDNEQVARFEKELELDLSFGIQGLGRFRTNVFLQRGAVGGALRIIPYNIKGFKELGLPENVCIKLCELPKGLILVTGATGSGKSTTLAAMLDYINETQHFHVLTVEDPIEFIHPNKKCLFNQREVGADTRGFKEALRSVLRQDPDVVLIGELRDIETIENALTVAETGHLTFATLHTSDCAQTINRIIDVFPAHQQQQVRTQLSFVLQAVFCQQLITKRDGNGRVLAAEILVANSAIRSMIRDDKVHQIYSQMQTGGKAGMRTLNQSLFDLVIKREIAKEEAMNCSNDPDDLSRMFSKYSNV